MRRWLLPLLLLVAGLLASPVLAQEGVRYRVATPADGATPESMMAAELAQLQTIEVAGDHLQYVEREVEGEVVRSASWTGNVQLRGGSVQLTTEALELIFLSDPEDPSADPEIASLTAGPVVEIRVRQDLVIVRGESLNFDFRERTGEVVHPTIDITLPEELLQSLGDLPLSVGDVQTTIHGDTVRLADNDVAIERPEIKLLAQGGRDLTLTASRVEILNPHPEVTRLRTRNLRITLENTTIVKLPWTQVFALRGSVPSGGFDVDFPSFFSAEEGLGMRTSAHYVFDAGDGDYVQTWSVGTRGNWVFSDRMYLQPFVAYQDPDLGELRLGYGTLRGISPIDDRSIPVFTAPELEWLGPRYELTDWLGVRPEVGVGHIDERSTGREADRVRATLFLSTPKTALLGSDRLSGRIEGKLDQRFYDNEFEQRIAEVGVVLQYVEPDSFGSEISYVRRDDTGFSPFLHDRLRLREEIGFRQKAIGPDGWNGLMRGLFDVEEDRWRTFELGVGKELEILEARVLYDTVSEAVRFELGYVGEI